MHFLTIECIFVLILFKEPLVYYGEDTVIY